MIVHDYIQNNLSPIAIGWLGPLLIIIVILVLGGRKLPYSNETSAFTYVFSILTGIVVDLTRDISNAESAMVAGIYTPPAFFAQFTFITIFRDLYVKHSSPAP